MSLLEDLPASVVNLIRSANTSHFATVSAAGVPIDTPLLIFPSEDLSHIGYATGLAYPVKAERARRNPKVGLLIEGRPDESVISIAGMAAVRDTDIQANAIRYIAETGPYSMGVREPWPLARKAVWYWSRIIMEVTPKRILWWDNPAAMDAAPQRWEAPAKTSYPASDPAPPGKPTAAPLWPQPEWRGWAKRFVDAGAAAHLTMLDAEGFPLSIGARKVTITDDGFDLDMPAAAPWSGAGVATLTYAGLATFVGPVSGSGRATHMRVERVLPVLPLMADQNEVLLPKPDTQATLMARLQDELDRRGLPLPVIPEEKPTPTPGALIRKARAEAAA
jgi:hypothetical protein